MSSRAFALITLLLFSSNAAYAQGFERGDSDCSLRLSAADVLLAVDSLTSGVGCNADCDRDEFVTVGDVDCSARCLFGECRVPAHAPQVANALPEANTGIRPYTALQISGTNFNSDTKFTTVTIGGAPAEILDILPSGDLIVMVPAIAPGPAELIVNADDLAGAPLVINVGPQLGIGEPDTFEDALDLLDELLMRYALLDLESFYGQEATTVRDAIATFRSRLTQQRAAFDSDPEVTAEFRAVLDTAIDSSGAADSLRQAITEVEAQADARFTRGAGPRAAAETIAIVARAARNITVAVRAAGAAAGTGLTATGAGIAISIGAVAGAVVIGASAALPPIIESATFRDRDGRTVGMIRVDGSVIVRGRRLAGSNLVIQTGKRRLVFSASVTADNFRQFNLGSFIGLCGESIFYLERPLPLVGRSEPIRWGIQPEITSVIPPDPFNPDPPLRANPGNRLQMQTLGSLGCPTAARFVRVGGAPAEVFSRPLTPVDNILSATVVPNVVSDEYDLELYVDGVISEPKRLRIDNGLGDLKINCTATNLKLAPATPSEATCTVTIPGNRQPPLGSRFVWSSANGGTATIDGGGASIKVIARHPGTTKISVEVKLGNVSLTEASEPPTIRVDDITPPSVSVDSLISRIVPSGITIPVTVDATDKDIVTRIVLHASGDAVLNPQQEVGCFELEDRCTKTLNVTLKDNGFSDTTITITADAYDGSGNKGTSTSIEFTVEENHCPQLTITSPPTGTVNPGATFLIEAIATDPDMNDGVKKFRYSASGDALTHGVSQDLVLPAAMMTSTLRFPIEIKNAQDLASVGNRVISVSVEAFDKVDKSCGAQTLSLTAAGTGDVQVTLSWNNSNDLDLAVVEPSGEQISYINPISTTGGRLDVDANPGCTAGSSSPVENIFWPPGQAPLGQYQVYVDFFRACTDPATSSTFTVRILVDGQARTPITGTIGSGRQLVTTFSR